MPGLQTQLESLNEHIHAKQQITLADAELGTSGVDALLVASLGSSDPVAISTTEEARIVDGRIQLTGRMDLLGANDLPATLALTDADGQMSLRVEAQCAKEWTIEKSFPALALERLAVEGLAIERFVFLSGNGTATGREAGLRPGLNLAARAPKLPILERAAVFFANGALPDTLPLSGPVAVKGETLDIELGTDFAGLPTLPAGLPSLTDGFLDIGLHVEPDADGKPSVRTDVFVGAHLEAAGKPLELLARVSPGGYFFLEAETADGAGIGLDDLSVFLGGSNAWQQQLPPALRDLGGFSLRRIILALDVPGKRVGSVGIDVGLEDWSPVDGVTVRELTARWTWYPDGGSHDLTLIGKATVADRYEVEVDVDSDLNVHGSLRMSEPLSLSKFLGHLGADVDVGFLGDIALGYLEVGASVHEPSFDLAVGLTADAPIAGDIEIVALNLDLGAAGGAFTGKVDGLVLYRGMPFALDFEVGTQDFEFSAKAASLNLANAVEQIAGTSLPAELSGAANELADVALTDVELTLKSGALLLKGTATGQWQLAAFGVGLGISEFGLEVRGSAATAGARGSLACEVHARSRVPSTVVEHFILESYDFGFAFDTASGWTLTGGAAARVFDFEMTLTAELAVEGDERRMALGWSADETVPLVAIDGMGAFGASKLTLSSTQSGGTTQWSLAGDGELSVLDKVKASGRLALELGKQTGLVLSELENATLNVGVPLVPGNADWHLGLSGELEQLAILRSPEAGWVLEVDTGLALDGLPDPIGDALPSRIDSVLRVSTAGVSLAIERLLDKVAIPLPEVVVGGTTVSLGAVSFDVAEVAVTVGKKPSVSGTLELGLPPEINYIFGVENGKPKINGINEQVSAKLGVDESGLFFELLTPLFNLGKTVREGDKLWQHIDLGEIGEVRFVQPKLGFNGSDFHASGAFEQVRPLGLPLGFLKTVLANAGLGGLADAMPGRIPLTEVRVLQNNELDVDALVRVLGEIGEATGTGGAIEDLKPVLEVIGERFNELPVSFREYLEIVLPDSFAFNVAITPGAGLGVAVDIRTGEDKPIKLLLPTGPGFTGIKLRRLLIGEIFGGALVNVVVDAEIDSFDLPTLAAIMALPVEQLKFLPDPTTVHQKFVARNLHMLIVTATGVPIPIPLFYDDLGFDALGLPGLGGGLKLQFPEPEAGVMDIAALLLDMWPFLSDPDVLLERDVLDKHKLKLSYGIEPAYVQTPKYTGNKLLGSRKSVLEVGVSQALVDMLNTLKSPRLGRIVRLVPLEKRVGADQVTFGPMRLDAAWAVTTDAEFSEIFVAGKETSKFAEQVATIPPAKRAELSSIIRFDKTRTAQTQEDGAIVLLLGGWSVHPLIDFKARLGLAQSVSLGYGFGFGLAGTIGKVGSFKFLDFEAKGSIVINVHDAKNPVILDGKSHITLAGHPVFVGDIQLADGAFHLQVDLNLFPDNWPVKVSGSGLVYIKSTGEVHLETDVDVVVANFTLVASHLELTNNSIEVSGTWLGVGARFKTTVTNGAIALEAGVDFDLVLRIDIGAIKIGGVKLTDGIKLANTRLAAHLATTIGEPGFGAAASAHFDWNGRTWSVPGFDLHTAPIDVDALLAEFERQIEKMAAEIFKALLDDPAKWAQAVKTGAIELAEDMGYVGTVLDEHFEQTAEEAAKVLKDAGYAADEVGGALKGAYDKTAAQAAAILRDAGYAAEDVGKALVAAYDISTAEILRILQAVDYGASEIATVMKNVFNYSATQVAQALKSMYKLGDQATKSILQGVGYAASAIDQTMKDVFNWTSGAADTVAEAAKKTWNAIKKY